MRRAVKAMIAGMVELMGRTRIGGYVLEQAVNAAMQETRSISYRDTKLRFAVPNRLNHFRIDTFSTKEPETLEWIDRIPPGSVVWDIGANVGLYTCYAAKARDCRVFAFEPSVFNLELLARNIFLNGLTSKVVIIPLPLCERWSFSTLNMTSTEWGGALSTFGQDYGWDGRTLDRIFEFRTLGVSADEATQKLRLPQPDYLKIDVDGIEHLVLRGATAVLKSVKSVLIEVNDGFSEQADQCQSLLMGSGLVLKEKRHSEMFSSADSFGGELVWNQVWVRPPAR
jgi:FkbM family methyltransferase